MTQITIQGVIRDPSTGLYTLYNSPVPLEVATYEVARTSKLRLYSLPQAFSDTAIMVGTNNPVHSLTAIVPQDFVNDDNIENLLAHLQLQDQLIQDIEGIFYAVQITNLGDVHKVGDGGSRNVYVVDLEAVETFNQDILNLPLITSTITTTGSTGDNSHPHVFFANGRYWVSYQDSILGTSFTSSPSGVTWRTPTAYGFNSTTELSSVVYNSFLNAFYYNIADGVQINWAKDVPNSNGTIIPGSNSTYDGTPAFTNGEAANDTNFWSVAGDDLYVNGVLVGNPVPDSFPHVLRASKTIASHVFVLGSNPGAAFPNFLINYTTNSAATWTTKNQLSNSASTRISGALGGDGSFDAVVVGDTIYVIWMSVGTVSPILRFATYTIGDAAPTATIDLDTEPGDNTAGGIATDGAGTFVVVYGIGVGATAGILYYQKSTDFGATWNGRTEIMLTGSFFPLISIDVAPDIVNGRVSLVWTDTPTTVRFLSFAP